MLLSGLKRKSAEGMAGGISFGSGFVQGLEEKMDKARGVVMSAMQDMNAMLNSVNSSATSISNITYSSPSYNFFSSGQTVSEQLSEARRAETVNELRGMQ